MVARVAVPTPAPTSKMVSRPQPKMELAKSSALSGSAVSTRVL
jgi:hypothetical protein